MHDQSNTKQIKKTKQTNTEIKESKQHYIPNISQQLHLYQNVNRGSQFYGFIRHVF